MTGSGITTLTFYALSLVTVTLQLIMYYRRAKFLRHLKGERASVINLKELGLREFGTMMQIIFPVKLDSVQDGHLNELRQSAVKASKHWIISLLVTLIVPIALINVLGTK